jgi:hypothetical protein
MRQNWLKLTTFLLCAALFMLSGQKAKAQYRSTVSGSVTDQSGAIIPNATVTITNTETKTSNVGRSNDAGIYSFPQLMAGPYSMTVAAPSFETYVQSGIVVALNTSSRIDVKLVIGSVSTTVKVDADASPLNYDNATISYDIPPEIEKQLPLQVSGKPRIAANIYGVLPGVNAGGVNGGMHAGVETTVDGVSIQEGDFSQGSTVSTGDFPMSPDVLTEVKVDTANFAVQFGQSGGGDIQMTTKSGTDHLHGDLYEYLKNTALNAAAFHSIKSPDNEHEYGGGVGGPLKPHLGLPSKIKLFYFFNFAQYKQKGGTNPPALTLPTLQELGETVPGSGSLTAQGPLGTYNYDFSDYKNSAGAIIPIYDPATEVGGNPATRKQFMGCDGLHPNVICNTYPGLSKRAAVWNGFLPNYRTSLDTSSNFQTKLAEPDVLFEGAWQYLYRFDMYIAQSDHVSVSVWHMSAPPKFNSYLPIVIANEQYYGNPESSWLNHLNWDHTFSPTLINHFAFGYENRDEAEGSLNYSYVDQLPKIPGVANSTQAPPAIAFSGGNGGQGYGRSDGYPFGKISTRPEFIPNDLVTWVRGKHQITLGGEFRAIRGAHAADSTEAGSFTFSNAQTGLPTGTNGNPQASFLIGQVATASSTYYSAPLYYKRENVEAVFGSDTWRISPTLTLNYGLRWDQSGPMTDKSGTQTWTDLSRANPGAGGRLGAIVFATPKAGNAYAGTDVPEKPFLKAFAPRVGFVFAPQPRWTVAAGYGISWDQLFIAALGSQTGWNNTASYSGTGTAGLEAPMNLDGSFPGDTFLGQTITLPDFDIGIGNGGVVSANWRDPDHGARRPYSQQWNLKVSRQLGGNTNVSIAYVGSKATHARSAINPQNSLDPKYLSLGSALNSAFASGSNTLTVNGTTYNAPYTGWSAQMKGCSPTLAQSLLPYPQFCSTLVEPLESSGFALYDSLQLSAEKRYANGLYLLTNFTWSKQIGTSNSESNSGAASFYSPTQQYRYHTLDASDDPAIFNFVAVYELPFGRGRKFMNKNRIADFFVGGWNVTDATQMHAGTPLSFSASCTRPSQFNATGCFATKLPGQKLWTMSKKAVDQALSTGAPVNVFNKNAFDASTNYQYNYVLTQGQRFTGDRGFGYVDYDVSLNKTFKVKDRMSFKLQGQFFNVLNQHSLQGSFGTTLTSSTFGQYTGSTTNPRIGQVVGRFEF